LQPNLIIVLEKIICHANHTFSRMLDMLLVNLLQVKLRFPEQREYRSIGCAVECEVLGEEVQAGVAVHFLQVARELLAAAEEVVELVVAKTYRVVVGYCAAIEDVTDISPHTCAETHMAGLAGRVDVAAREIEGAEILAGIAYCGDFAVAGGVVVPDHTVVAAAYYAAISDDDGAEGAAVAGVDAVAGFIDGHLHVLVKSFFQYSHRRDLFLPIHLQRGRKILSTAMLLLASEQSRRRESVL